MHIPDRVRLSGEVSSSVALRHSARKVSAGLTRAARPAGPSAARAPANITINGPAVYAARSNQLMRVALERSPTLRARDSCGRCAVACCAYGSSAASRLARRDVWPQPDNNVQPCVAIVVHQSASGKRYPEFIAVHRARIADAFEFRACDADDFKGIAIQRDLPSNNSRIAAEACPPCLLRQHDDCAFTRHTCIVFLDWPAKAGLAGQGSCRRRASKRSSPRLPFRAEASGGRQSPVPPTRRAHPSRQCVGLVAPRIAAM
jgi:hypothetical protein